MLEKPNRWATLSVMTRALLVMATAVVALLAVVAPAGSTDRVRATLTTTIPANKSGGDSVVIGWRLRNTSGHLVSVRRAFVKIVCPTGEDSTTTYAVARADGTFRVVAVVPPGGIGTVSIGAGKSQFPITNPFHR
jgi:hypothetical protein